MAKDPIIFACANPTPEIFPDEAKAAGAAVVSTGRSDFPNQVNNVLCFPGIFRGALDVRASDINDEMKVAAAYSGLYPSGSIRSARKRRSGKGNSRSGKKERRCKNLIKNSLDEKRGNSDKDFPLFFTSGSLKLLKRK